MLALAGAAIGLAVGAIAFLAHGGGLNSARFAADMVLRAASLAFIVSFLALPLSRLIPGEATAMLGRERCGLTLAFAAMYGVFLVNVVLPFYLTGHMPLPSLVFSLFSALILAVMLIGTYPAAVRFLGRQATRTLESLAVGYFWLAFAFADFDFIVGPHRPDYFHGISLTLLLAALALRFADAFLQRRKVRLADAAA